MPARRVASVRASSAMAWPRERASSAARDASVRARSSLPLDAPPVVDVPVVDVVPLVVAPPGL